MKIENNKFVELTETELFSLYLERGMDDVMDFHEYRNRMEDCGCKIIEGGTKMIKRSCEDKNTIYLCL